eukprot:GFYU01009248.1.p1 GENE.GFYU01009248.1~~GFYU01009248.1.p1  ORF type:complete len:169 (-),score=29.91 GFYU01009248.1:82-588(-)
MAGRTEAQRSVTPEAYKFAETFCSKTASRDEKMLALKNAVAAHVRTVRLCTEGKGCDRILYALQCLSVDEGLPMPEIFTDKAWGVLNTTILSTSNCGSTALRMFGFGPVSQQGFGLGYIIKDHSFQICVTSKHRQTDRFFDALKDALLEMRDICEGRHRGESRIQSKL